MSESTHNSVDDNEEIVSLKLCAHVKVKIFSRKNAYLLKELSNMQKSYLRNIALPFINDTKLLPQYLEKNLQITR